MAVIFCLHGVLGFPRVRHRTRKETLEAHLLEVKNLGLQATQRVVDSADPLQAMIDLSFNFPEIAPALSHTTVDDLTRSAVMEKISRC